MDTGVKVLVATLTLIVGIVFPVVLYYNVGLVSSWIVSIIMSIVFGVQIGILCKEF